MATAMAKPAGLPDGHAELHRFNQQLPEVYKSQIPREAKLMHRALHRLTRAIKEAEPDSGRVDVGGNDPAGSEGYEWRIERDLSALDKGMARYLDLKYPLQSADYDTFCSVFLQALLTPAIDLGIRAKMVRSMARLMKKRDCSLSFSIPWRRILDMIKKIHLDSAGGGLYIGRDIRDAHCREMITLIRKCRDYLPQGDDARSIWDEMAPQIDPSRADTAFEPLLFLYHLLPTRGDQWTGWLEPAIELWSRLETSTDYDSVWLGLFSRLAKHQPNVLDWTPYLTMVYEKIPAFFKLPLGAAAPHSPIERRCQAHLVFLLTSKNLTFSTAVFAIYSLTPQHPAPLRFLKKLLTVFANFFHPSNNGRWSNYLSAFVGHLTSSLVERVALERSATRAGVCGRVLGSHSVKALPPVEHRLTDEYVDDLVNVLFPLIQAGLHAKQGYVTLQSAASARDLATVSPHLVVQPLLDAAAESLVSPVTPHRTSAALKTLATLTPVFLDQTLFPQGAASLSQALELTLPGIDANDPSKTEATFRFIAGASASLQSHRSHGSTSEIDGFLDDYAHSLLDRIIILLEALEAPPKKPKNGPAPAPTLSSFIFSVAVENFFSACPASVATSAAQRVARHVSGAASANALKFYGALVRITAAAAASVSTNGTSAPIFVPLLVNQIVEEDGQGAVVLSSLSEDELVWRLRILAQACRTCNDTVSYGDRIFKAINLALRHPARKVYKAGGRLLRGLLEGLTSIRMCFGVGSPNMANANSNFEWRIPSKEEYEAGAKYLTKAIEVAEDLCTRPGTERGQGPLRKEMVYVDRDRLFPAVRALHAAQRGGRWLLAGALHPKFTDISRFENQEDEKEFDKDRAKVLLKLPVSVGLAGDPTCGDPERAKALWSRIYMTISNVLQASMDQRPDDGALLNRCLEPIEMAHEQFRKTSGGRMSSRAERGYKLAYKPIVMMKQDYNAIGGVGREMPRFIQKLRLQALHEARMSTSARASHCHEENFNTLMDQLTELTRNDFPLVRSRARGVLTRSLRVATPKTRREIIGRSIDGLTSSIETVPSKGTPNYEGMMGAADVLRSSAVAPLVTRDWSLFSRCGRALVNAIVAAERTDSAVVVGSLFAKLASTARCLCFGSLTLAELGDANPTIPQDRANDKLALYSSFVQFLLSKATGGDLDPMTNGSTTNKEPAVGAHWRLQSLVATLLYICVRHDVRVPDNVIEFFIRSMTSEIVALRQIAVRAVALLLALSGRGELTDCEGVMRVITQITSEKAFARKLIHTLALDQTDDSEGEAGNDAAGLFANLSVTSLARNVDGEACWSLIMGRPWPSSWVPRSRDSLSIVRVRLFELLSAAAGEALVTAVADTLDDLLKEDASVRGVTRENCRILVAEVVGGLGRGITNCENDEILSKLTDWSTSLLEAFSGQEGIVNGGSFIRFLASGDLNSVGRAIMNMKLREYLKAPLINQSESGNAQARQIRYVSSLLADAEPGCELVVESCCVFTPQLVAQEAMSHSLKHVREEIARCLSLLSNFNAPDAKEAYSKGVNSVLVRLTAQETVSVDQTEDEATSLKKTRSREGECLSRWLAVVSWNGDTRAFAPQIAQLLPAVFASLDESDPERVSHARLALSLAAQARFDGETLERVLRASVAASKSPRWRIRGSTLAFLQVVAFSRIFTEVPNVSRQVREIVLHLLSDDQLEVREAAAYTLVPLIRDADLQEVEEVRERFLQSLMKTKPPSRRRGSERTPVVEAVERHSAVLGLSSMVRSAPYTIPDWMPNVLVALTSCIGDPVPISTSTGKIFTEFWRTHRDEWAVHKQAFEADDLDAVSELLTAPSYYA